MGLSAPDVVNGLRELLQDVAAVEDTCGVGGALGGDTEVGPPFVGATNRQLGGALLAEPLDGVLEGLDLAVVADPEPVLVALVGLQTRVR